MILDVLLDTLLDCVKLLPFLFITYLAMEYLEHYAGDKTARLVERTGAAGPVLGGLLGVVPQCGFSSALANLYAGGLISRGTLLAVFLSTSDEMLPILISRQAEAGLILKILAVKAASGILIGLAVDALTPAARRKRADHIHELCDEAHCGCEEEKPFRSALIHTARILGFIFLITLVMNLAVELVGQERLAGLVLNVPVLGELIAGVIGLIPNCAASVVITELYLQGVLSTGAMLSGLLTGSGVGLLILFRIHRHGRDNLKTLGLLYGTGVLVGLLLGQLPIF